MISFIYDELTGMHSLATINHMALSSSHLPLNLGGEQESCSPKMGDDHGDNMSTEPDSKELTKHHGSNDSGIASPIMLSRQGATLLFPATTSFQKHQFSSKFVNCTCWSVSPMVSGTNPIMTAMWNSDHRSSTNDYVVPMAMVSCILRLPKCSHNLSNIMTMTIRFLPPLPLN
jgi:hypothetical protein